MNSLEIYLENAVKTECPYNESTFNRVESHIRLLHGVMGLSSETGELVEQVKKHIFYGKPLDVVNLEEEIGDLFWYVAIILKALNCHDPVGILEQNIEKLKIRYPEKFQSKDAINRDLDKERKTLEDNSQSTNKPL